MMGEISPAGPGENLPSAHRLRASHEDRDRVIEMLRVAAGDGRLTSEELDERVEIAFSARTYGELAALTSDLPASGEAIVPAAPAAPGLHKNVVRLETKSGNLSRVGRWVVPRRIEARVTSGNIKLDFTDAVIAHRSIEIEADVRSGNLVIITKPGIAVDTDDVVIRSGNVRVKAPWGSQAPVTVQINVSGRVGSGNIVARPPRRSFWDWLMRRPRRYAITSGA
ncbi:MAG TPA: DUF1707 domain-containing protein [Streptosporangiaceae bacterium]|jgi:hypothetical protein|nr:DUF1707 domain-containing protein [Streptosporangiaceae bacterium]